MEKKGELPDIPASGKKNPERLIFALRIASVVFMLGMIALVICVFRKYNIKMNIKDAENISRTLTENISGGLVAVAAFIILFSVGKSFVLVFPPAVIFAVTGLCFRGVGYGAAVLVNVVATALSLVIPYYLGRLNGRAMADSLKRKFKKVRKLDDFAGKNDFALVLIIKASGMLPSDVSSLLFGAMGLPFGKYFLASNLGMLLLNLAWTALAVYGDITNPVSWLIVLPCLLIAVVPVLIMKAVEKKKARAAANAVPD